MKNFKKGQKVEFSGETYTFISSFKHQGGVFAIIFDGKNRDFQPIEFIK